MICLPGVPAEMVEMWHDSVGATIAGFVGAGRRVIRRRLLHCFGAGESQIEAMLPDLIRRGRRPTVGITASKATITLRIAADGASEAECHAAIAPVEATIRQCLGTLLFGEEDDELQHVVVRLLRERGKTLATAECALWDRWPLGSAARRCGRCVSRRVVLHGSAESADVTAANCREPIRRDYGLAIWHSLIPLGEGPGVRAAFFPLPGEGPGVRACTNNFRCHRLCPRRSVKGLSKFHPTGALDTFFAQNKR